MPIVFLMQQASYIGPGDLFPDAEFWGGLRGYNSISAATNMPAINVRRDSDNADMDIVVLNDGTLDVATATTFASGANLFVTTLYDQSGFGLNAIQGTNATQPQLHLSGGPASSLPYMSFNGSQFLRASGALTGNTGSTSFMSQRTANFTTLQSVAGCLSGIGVGHPAVANEVYSYAGTLTTATAIDSTWHAVQTTYNGASSIIMVDGSSVMADPGGATGGDAPTIGDGPLGGEPVTGYIFEVGLWNPVLSGAQASELNAAQHALGGGW